MNLAIPRVWWGIAWHPLCWWFQSWGAGNIVAGLIGWWVQGGILASAFALSFLAVELYLRWKVLRLLEHMQLAPAEYLRVRSIAPGGEYVGWTLSCRYQFAVGAYGLAGRCLNPFVVASYESEAASEHAKQYEHQQTVWYWPADPRVNFLLKPKRQDLFTSALASIFAVSVFTLALCLFAFKLQ